MNDKEVITALYDQIEQFFLNRWLYSSWQSKCVLETRKDLKWWRNLRIGYAGECMFVNLVGIGWGGDALGIVNYCPHTQGPTSTGRITLEQPDSLEQLQRTIANIFRDRAKEFKQMARTQNFLAPKELGEELQRLAEVFAKGRVLA